MCFCYPFTELTADKKKFYFWCGGGDIFPKSGCRFCCRRENTCPIAETVAWEGVRRHMHGRERELVIKPSANKPMGLLLGEKG